MQILILISLILYLTLFLVFKYYTAKAENYFILASSDIPNWLELLDKCNSCKFKAQSYFMLSNIALIFSSILIITYYVLQ